MASQWHQSAFLVTDEIDGIALEHLGRLTDRFYRVDRTFQLNWWFKVWDFPKGGLDWKVLGSTRKSVSKEKRLTDWTSILRSRILQRRRSTRWQRNHRQGLHVPFWNPTTSKRFFCLAHSPSIVRSISRRSVSGLEVQTDRTINSITDDDLERNCWFWSKKTRKTASFIVC